MTVAEGNLARRFDVGRLKFAWRRLRWWRDHHCRHWWYDGTETACVDCGRVFFGWRRWHRIGSLRPDSA